MRRICSIALALAISGLLLVPMFLDTKPTNHLSHAPWLTNPLGTTPTGEDVLAIIFTGGRRLLVDGICCALVAAVVGGLWAALEFALSRSFLFGLMQRLRAVVDAIGPTLPLAAFAAVFPRSPTPVLVIVLGMLAAPSIAGPIYSSSQRAYSLPHIQASRCLGVRPLRLFWKGVLPEISVVLFPWIGAFAAQAAAFLSGLGFLGIGIGSQSSLGMRLFDAAGSIRIAPWFFVGASVMTLCVLALSVAAGRMATASRVHAPIQ